MFQQPDGKTIGDSAESQFGPQLAEKVRQLFPQFFFFFLFQRNCARQLFHIKTKHLAAFLAQGCGFAVDQLEILLLVRQFLEQGRGRIIRRFRFRSSRF